MIRGRNRRRGRSVGKGRARAIERGGGARPATGTWPGLEEDPGTFPRAGAETGVGGGARTGVGEHKRGESGKEMSTGGR